MIQWFVILCLVVFPVILSIIYCLSIASLNYDITPQCKWGFALFVLSLVLVHVCVILSFTACWYLTMYVVMPNKSYLILISSCLASSRLDSPRPHLHIISSWEIDTLKLATIAIRFVIHIFQATFWTNNYNYMYHALSFLIDVAMKCAMFLWNFILSVRVFFRNSDRGIILFLFLSLNN